MRAVLKEIRKHFKIYAMLVRMNIMSQMEYRANFVTGMMMEIGGFLDPARIFGELCRVERRQIRAAA